MEYLIQIYVTRLVITFQHYIPNNITFLLSHLSATYIVTISYLIQQKKSFFNHYINILNFNYDPFYIRKDILFK